MELPQDQFQVFSNLVLVPILTSRVAALIVAPAVLEWWISILLVQIAYLWIMSKLIFTFRLVLVTKFVTYYFPYDAINCIIY